MRVICNISKDWCNRQHSIGDVDVIGRTGESLSCVVSPSGAIPIRLRWLAILVRSESVVIGGPRCIFLAGGHQKGCFQSEGPRLSTHRPLCLVNFSAIKFVTPDHFVPGESVFNVGISVVTACGSNQQRCNDDGLHGCLGRVLVGCDDHLACASRVAAETLFLS